jgi:PAS domain S-box-containing protein
MTRQPSVSLAEHLKLALEASEDAVAWTDRAGRVQWCNSRLAAAARLRPSEASGRDLRELLPLESTREDSDRTNPVAAVLAGRPLPPAHYRLRREGPLPYYQVAGSWLTPPGEEPMAVFWLHDVTRQRLADREANRVAAVHAVTQEAAVCLTLRGLVTHWNSAAERIYGYAAEEIVGKTVDSFVPPAGRGRFAEAVARLRAGEGPIQMESGHARKDGTLLRVEITAAGWKDEDGALGGIAVVARDVTRQRRMEAIVQMQLDELLESNKQLESFAARASHDLLEPVRVIKAFSEILERRASGELSDKSRDLLSHIQASTGRMARLVEGLLDYSRLRGQKLAPERVELAPVIREVLADLELRLERSQAAVEVGPLPAVRAHRVHMRQLFSNLLGNALKFTDPSRLPRVSVKAAPSARDGFVDITVEDNGIGFDASDAERIFEPFARLHARDEYEGSGIGLPVCRAIAEKHGGGIRAEGEKGRGARFTVTLPLAGGAQSKEAS